MTNSNDLRKQAEIERQVVEEEVFEFLDKWHERVTLGDSGKLYDTEIEDLFGLLSKRRVHIITITENGGVV